MEKKWNVVRDFYNKKTVFKPMPSQSRFWKDKGYYLISFEEAEQIKEKYFNAGMQEYFNRYMEQKGDQKL